MSIAVSIRVARNSRCVVPFWHKNSVLALYGCVELINKTLDEYWVMVLF